MTKRMMGGRRWTCAIVFCAVSIASGVALPVARGSSNAPSAPDDVAKPGRGARKTRSGLAMKILVAGRGKEHPQVNDCVKLRYVAWKRDGALHALSDETSAPEIQCLRRL